MYVSEQARRLKEAEEQVFNNVFQKSIIACHVLKTSVVILTHM
jgi:hypothetical protein